MARNDKARAASPRSPRPDVVARKVEVDRRAWERFEVIARGIKVAPPASAGEVAGVLLEMMAGNVDALGGDAPISLATIARARVTSRRELEGVGCEDCGAVRGSDCICGPAELDDATPRHATTTPAPRKRCRRCVAWPDPCEACAKG